MSASGRADDTNLQRHRLPDDGRDGDEHRVVVAAARAACKGAGAFEHPAIMSRRQMKRGEKGVSPASGDHAAVIALRMLLGGRPRVGLRLMGAALHVTAVRGIRRSLRRGRWRPSRSLRALRRYDA